MIAIVYCGGSGKSSNLVASKYPGEFASAKDLDGELID